MVKLTLREKSRESWVKVINLNSFIWLCSYMLYSTSLRTFLFGLKCPVGFIKHLKTDSCAVRLERDTRHVQVCSQKKIDKLPIL